MSQTSEDAKHDYIGREFFETDEDFECYLRTGEV